MGVEKVTLNGRVRITLKPLMDEMPIVAAMQVRPFHWHMLPASSGQSDCVHNGNDDDDTYNNHQNAGLANRQHG